MRKAWNDYILPLLFAVMTVLAIAGASQSWAGYPVEALDPLDVEQAVYDAVHPDETASAERSPEALAVITYNDTIAIAHASEQPSGGAAALRRLAVIPVGAGSGGLDPSLPFDNERLRRATG